MNYDPDYDDIDIIESLECEECNFIANSEASLFLHVQVRHKGKGLSTLEPPWDPKNKKRIKDLTPDEKRLRLRNKVVQRITRNGKELEFVDTRGKAIEVIVDEYGEVWARLGTAKMKKICGARKKPYQLCMLPAGFGTDHSGYGLCKFHFGNADKVGNGASPKNNYLKPFLHQPGNSLRESLERVMELSDGEIYDTSQSLRVAYALLDRQLNEGMRFIECGDCGSEVPVDLQQDSIPEIRKTLEQIRKIIETRATIQAKLTIDLSALSLFVRSILEVIRPYIRTEDWDEFLSTLYNQVALPMGDRTVLTQKRDGIFNSEKVDAPGESNGK